jgi:hypothetical protein
MFDKTFLDQLKDKHEQWEETTLQRSLARLPERMDERDFMTTSSEPIHRLYTPQRPNSPSVSGESVS